MDVLETLALERSHPDLDLARAVLRRDRKACAEFVQRYSDVVYGYLARRLAPHAAAAEDLLQEVFLAALHGLPQYQGAAPLQAWIMAIARNKVEDHYRSRLRVVLEELPDGDETAPPSPESAVDVRLDQERVLERAATLLDRMPEGYRELLLWRYWEHKATKDIANETGRTVKSVERMLARAKEQFRRLWLEEDKRG